jgi:hypothetical protein
VRRFSHTLDTDTTMKTKFDNFREPVHTHPTLVTTHPYLVTTHPYFVTTHPTYVAVNRTYTGLAVPEQAGKGGNIIIINGLSSIDSFN